MGCHTWFCRPITKGEFILMKKHALSEIRTLIVDSEENIRLGSNNKCLYESLMKSYYEDIPCVYGKYWWQLGYGSGHPKLNGVLVHEVKGEFGLFVDVVFDIFRVKNYPSKVIHNRKELRRWMGKKYFELEDSQLEEISKFFKANPGGVIVFG